MANILDGSIVRIFDAGGAIAGLGFLVTKNVIFTCSHILVKGKKRQLDDRQEFTDHILLDFPLIYPNQILEATVLLLDEETDVGVLRFLDESPTGTQPVPLVLADDLWGHTFRAFGFPENYDDGVWSDGILRGQNARGWIQIEGVRGTGYAIRPGFSGTPVWDDYLSGVVGMVVAADTTIQSYSAFIIPTNHLVRSVTSRGLVSLDYKVEHPRNISQEEGRLASKRASRASKRLISSSVSATNNELRTAYLNRVLEDANVVPLYELGLENDRNVIPSLSLGSIYTALMTMNTDDFSQTDVELPNEDDLNYVSALAQLNKHKHLVLLGDPGSGKTTFINFVAMCLAGEIIQSSDANLSLLTRPLLQTERQTWEVQNKLIQQSWNHGALLPIRITLRDLAAGMPFKRLNSTASDIWHFVQFQLDQAGLGEYVPHLKKELLEAGGILLLDGLDEVPEAEKRRIQIKQAIDDFAKSFKKCRILVTSRTYAYQKQEWKLSGFSEAVLAYFNNIQIQQFIRRWYDHFASSNKLADTLADSLNEAIFSESNYEYLLDLARRPLLLTQMSILHQTERGKLPEKREQLYAKTVDLLLNRWEGPKVVRLESGKEIVQPSLSEWLRIDQNQVLNFLGEEAFRVQNTQQVLSKTADISEENLLLGLLRLSKNPDIRPARLLEYLNQRAGILIPRGEGVFSFPHRTYQEYLAACYLATEEYPDKIADLARNNPYRWREVVVLTGAKRASLDNSDESIWALAEALCWDDSINEDLKEKDGWGAIFAGQLIMEMSDFKHISARNQRELSRVKKFLRLILEKEVLSPRDRIVAGEILGKLGDPRFQIYILNGAKVITPQMVFVPEGEYTIGSADADENAEDREKPQHKVRLSPYYIGKWPVTNSEFACFVEAGGYTNELFWTTQLSRDWLNKKHLPDEIFSDWMRLWKRLHENPNWKEELEKAGNPRKDIEARERIANLSEAEYRQELVEREQRKSRAQPQFWNKIDRNNPSQPVVGITWFEALAYCTWLSVVTAEKYRLPTEVEWEAAARGGDGLIFPWGNIWDESKANTKEGMLGKPSIVGAYTSGTGPFETQDQCGNVWEWTSSLSLQYPYKSEEIMVREELESIGERVGKGGSWDYGKNFSRCAYRNLHSPITLSNNYGFRIVRDIS